MDSNEFWCRAFLTTMAPVFQACIGTGAKEDNVAAQCADMADAALAVAQRRGMVTAGDVAKAVAESPAPEAVEFTAALASHGQWVLRVSDLSGGFLVPSGLETVGVNGVVVRIQWDETCPPRPIKVWIEKGGS